MKLLNVSGSPHVHGNESIKRIMWDVNIALLPIFIVSLIFFGLDALFVSLVSVFCCLLFQWLIEKFLLKQPTTITDGSAVITGLLLAFNVPSNLPLWIVAIGAFVAIAIGKMTFGGLGKNPFNPALVGRVFLLISFPAQMTTWPRPMAMNLSFNYFDAETGATTLSMLKGGFGEIPSLTQMLFGEMGGSLGEVSAIALLIGLIYLLATKTITWHIPVSILVTVFAMTGIFYLVDPETYANPLVHLLSGGLLLGAIFMATDYVTSPMTHKGQLIYGFGIGLITCVIRLWGAYPEGMSFAILIMNAATPLINNYVKPTRFGAKEKGGKQ